MSPTQPTIAVYLRSSAFFLVHIVFTVVFCSLAPILFGWLPLKPRTTLMIQWNRVTIALLKWICGIHYRVSGFESLPAGPNVIAAKHQSTWETYYFQMLFPQPLSTILKRELLRIPFFGWCLALMNPIAIDRSSPREALKQIFEKGRSRIEKGISVLIFPEGTRSQPGQRGKYARGAAAIAEATQVAVIPVAHNAGECWPGKGFLKYPGTVDVVIGPAISSEGKTSKQLSGEVEEWIESTMLEINGKARR